MQMKIIPIGDGAEDMKFLCAILADDCDDVDRAVEAIVDGYKTIDIEYDESIKLGAVSEHVLTTTGYDVKLSTLSINNRRAM